ncbi:MAG TPA: hypothetical protein VH394_12545 [Thermoanaerobaculia bacterium]|jgi:hypothetical protein|nr:hypothetical protein [Thermoanaerobaculia bacterium]
MRPRLFTLAVLSLGLLVSCNKPPAPAPDPRAELVGSLNGADVQGFLFSLNEEENRTTSSLTNKAVNDLIRLDPKTDTSLPLRYTRVQENGTASTSRTEVVKKGGSLALVVSDVATGKVIDQRELPTPGPTCAPAGQFDSLQACIQKFNCDSRGTLLCEANRTCKAQFAALTCCLKNGTIFSVHLVVNPDSLRCQLGVFPDLEGLVLSQG